MSDEESSETSNEEPRESKKSEAEEEKVIATVRREVRSRRRSCRPDHALGLLQSRRRRAPRRPEARSREPVLGTRAPRHGGPSSDFLIDVFAANFATRRGHG